MTPLLIQKKNKRTTSKNKLAWPSVVFQAMADGEQLNEVTIKTLRSHYEDLVHLIAFKKSGLMNFDVTVKEIANSGKVRAKQFIHIDENLNVTVCIDEPIITDDSMERALDKLVDISIKPNTEILFGPYKSFTWDELQSNPVDKSY